MLRTTPARSDFQECFRQLEFWHTYPRFSIKHSLPLIILPTYLKAGLETIIYPPTSKLTVFLQQYIITSLPFFHQSRCFHFIGLYILLVFRWQLQLGHQQSEQSWRHLGRNARALLYTYTLYTFNSRGPSTCGSLAWVIRQTRQIFRNTYVSQWGFNSVPVGEI